MFNHHSLIPWDHFRVDKKNSGDHFGVDFGIISRLGIILGSGSLRGLYRRWDNFGWVSCLASALSPVPLECSLKLKFSGICYLLIRWTLVLMTGLWWPMKIKQMFTDFFRPTATQCWRKVKKTCCWSKCLFSDKYIIFEVQSMWIHL